MNRTTTVILAVLALRLAQPASAAIQGSPHDLAATRGGNSCGYCHTPHGALTGTPLWNHRLSDAVYKIYESSSLEAKVGQPTGSSKLCLSCHDGTVALGETITGGQGGGYIPPGPSHIGTDLSDDHPVSFVYSSSLSAQDMQISLVSTVPEIFRLDRSGEVQCTTCHDPHDNQYGDFLVMSNVRSRMCTMCHDLRGWTGSSHESSTASVLAADDSYLQQRPYHIVADNGCNSCHRPHSAGGRERLLHFDAMEANCLNCHNGSVATTDLTRDLMKASRHDVRSYDGVHDIRESVANMPEHVECVDCHDAHAVRRQSAQPPLAPGALRGVSGLSASGAEVRQVQYEYEVCYKCHAENFVRDRQGVARRITQTNVRLEFDASNPSFHPVVTQGKNPHVPSLEPPLTPASMIYCTDCHSSDPTSGVAGPHGSIYRPLLRYNYETSDFTQESEFAYQLCYSCHSRNSLLANESFKGHRQHITSQIPCSACHDAHGISSAQGNSRNNTHLINFDIQIVQPETQTGRLEFIDDGTFRGRCYLLCHGENHSPKEY